MSVDYFALAIGDVAKLHIRRLPSQEGDGPGLCRNDIVDPDSGDSLGTLLIFQYSGTVEGSRNVIPPTVVDDNGNWVDPDTGEFAGCPLAVTQP